MELVVISSHTNILGFLVDLQIRDWDHASLSLFILSFKPTVWSASKTHTHTHKMLEVPFCQKCNLQVQKHSYKQKVGSSLNARSLSAKLWQMQNMTGFTRKWVKYTPHSDEGKKVASTALSTHLVLITVSTSPFFILRSPASMASKSSRAS